MSLIPHHMVATVADLARWCRAAPANSHCIYHAGALPVDRHKDQVLNQLADTFLLLQETRFVTLQQRRVYLLIEDAWAYWAVRTSGGYAPKAILSQKLTSFEWRALRAVRDRDADISATRAIRDALSFATSSSDAEAEAILERMKARRFVREAPGKGWELSPAGLEVLI